MPIPYDLWGLLSETWTPALANGVTVFLQGLEKRGPHNERKRIYMSALTPNLYRPMYGDKVVQFFDKLLETAMPASRSCGPISKIISTSIGTYTWA